MTKNEIIEEIERLAAEAEIQVRCSKSWTHERLSDLLDATRLRAADAQVARERRDRANAINKVVGPDEGLWGRREDPDAMIVERAGWALINSVWPLMINTEALASASRSAARILKLRECIGREIEGYRITGEDVAHATNRLLTQLADYEPRSVAPIDDFALLRYVREKYPKLLKDPKSDGAPTAQTD